MDTETYAQILSRLSVVEERTNAQEKDIDGAIEAIKGIQRKINIGSGVIFAVFAALEVWRTIGS